MSTKPAGRQLRIFKNGIYSALSWVFPIVFALIVTPVVVRGLGNELYGLYTIIVGFISYSFTFGIGKTAAKFVSEYKATGETDKISETVSSAFWLSLGWGVVGAAIVALTANYIVTNVLLIPPQLQDTAVIAVYLACFTILVTMLSQVFQYVLQGLQRFDLFLFLTNLSVFLLNLGSVLIVIEGYSVLVLLVWNLIVAFAVGTAFYFNARRLLPEFTFRFSINIELWKASLNYSFSIIIYQVFGNILLLFERGWIVRKFGTQALTFYVVPMMIGLYFHGFISSLVLVIFPVINELLTDKEKLNRLYQTSSKIIITLTGFFLVTTIVTGHVFLKIWMTDEFAVASYWVLVNHALTFSVLSVVVVVWQMNESHRAASVNAIVTVLWLLISVPLMIILSYQWQLTGIAFARFVGVTIFLAMIFFAEQRFLGGVAYKFWASTLVRLILASALTGFAEWFILGMRQPGWVTLIVAGVGGGAVYSLALVVTGFLKEDEKLVLKDLILNWRAAK